MPISCRRRPGASPQEPRPVRGWRVVERRVAGVAGSPRDPLSIPPVPAVRGFVQSASPAERLPSGRSGGGTLVAHCYILKGCVIIGKIGWLIVFVLFFLHAGLL